ncbi:MAG: heme lyase CcmF/NrfE family subunit [Sulfuricellaceae bacterium]|nr:heme lyase CcmF/NrfE family subunit [Sulfuricellaceae bacterium]
MNTVLGQYSLILALVLAASGGTAALVGLGTQQPAWVRVARNAIFLIFVLLTISMGTLEYAFLSHDYSLKYVAAHSNNTLPTFYLATAMWGGHEGSFLLWAWLLALYSAVAARLHWRTHPQAMPYLLAINAALMLGFMCLIVFLADPFEVATMLVPDGAGLNPLLQDPGMVFHPPFLYMGYVGFSIPFAFAMAALLRGTVNEEWVKATRRWTLFAWLMLTFGIVLGGYWAYYELGWGGYWAWDPVENASFMPWLVGTAFLHSVMVQETRRMFKIWNVFLIIVTFSLTLLGAFLVRSGVVSSVHSFASDPGRGVFILAFMTVVLVFSFGTLIVRGDKLKSEVAFDAMVSRETAFLFNNLFFLVAMATVFVGTLYPLLLESLTGAKVTVGAPYYNAVFLPIMLLMVALMGVGPLLPWRKASLAALKRNALWPGVLAAIGTALTAAVGLHEIFPLLGMAVVYFVFGSILRDFHVAARGSQRRASQSYLPALIDAVRRNKRRFGGLIVHFGVLMMIVGLIASAVFKIEKDVVLKAGDSFALGSYSVLLKGVTDIRGANYSGTAAILEVSKPGEKVIELRPEKRTYIGSGMPTTEAAIHENWLRDIYLVLDKPTGDAYIIKAYFNPLVKWIWTGVMVMGFGTALSLWQRRRSMGDKA